MKKYCPTCKEHKEAEEFSSNKRNADGLAVYCRLCNAAKQREWKRANPDKIKAWKKRYLEQSKLEAHYEQ